MARIVVITPPAALLTPADIREQLMLPASVSDGVLSRLVKVATQEVDGPDGWLGRALGAQVLELRDTRFPSTWCDGLRLLCEPIGELVAVAYDDAAGVARSIELGDCEMHGAGLFLRPGVSWPATSGRRSLAGARIETWRIARLAHFDPVAPSRERGLKRLDPDDAFFPDAVAPSRERGLKRMVSVAITSDELSLPRGSAD